MLSPTDGLHGAHHTSSPSIPLHTPHSTKPPVSSSLHASNPTKDKEKEQTITAQDAMETLSSIFAQLQPLYTSSSSLPSSLNTCIRALMDPLSSLLYAQPDEKIGMRSMAPMLLKEMQETSEALAAIHANVQRQAGRLSSNNPRAPMLAADIQTYVQHIYRVRMHSIVG